jgi:steroid delta-isomerase-like uncharacterized protein
LPEIVPASQRSIANVLAFLFVLLTTAPVAKADQSPLAAASEQDRNKAVARRVFDEIFNQGKFEVADEIYAPDFVNHGYKRNVSLQVDQAAVHQEKAAFPDLKMSVEVMVAEGDLVTILWTFRGTHTAGGYGGLPATGTPIEMRGITIWRIVDGKIREEWSSFDELGAYSQVVRHVQGKLWIALGAFLVLVVAAERLLWIACKWLVRLFRHKPTQA